MPDPVCSLIAFCDLVVTEQNTGKNTLVGTFHSLAWPQFPFTIPRFFVHVAISNLVLTGKPISIAINVKQPQTGAVVGSFGMPVNIPIPPDPPKEPIVVNFNIPFTNVVFPSPGDYAIEILFDGEHVGERILAIRQRPLNPPINPQNI